MGKIIKQTLDKKIIGKNAFSLSMKGEFTIEFASDNFGPYNYKFEREDCYFNDELLDRGTVEFPLKNKQFNNTEIFLETNDIVVCIGKRGGLSGEDKDFIDVINIKTEKKSRIFTSEVNLIYNSLEFVVVNAKIGEIFKTFYLDFATMEIIKEVEEELQAFFKCIYNTVSKKWFLLDYKNETLEKQNIKTVKNEDLGKLDFELLKNGYFEMRDLGENFVGKTPTEFNRLEFLVKCFNSESISVWDLSCL